MSTHNRKNKPARPLDLRHVIQSFPDLQKTFGLSSRSLTELAIHLESLRSFCKGARMASLEELSPENPGKDLDLHAPRGKTHLELKVWPLHTFGA